VDSGASSVLFLGVVGEGGVDVGYAESAGLVAVKTVRVPDETRCRAIPAEAERALREAKHGVELGAYLCERRRLALALDKIPAGWV
jgi:hypothetical protein